MKKWIIIVICSCSLLSYSQELARKYESGLQKMQKQDYTGAITDFTSIINQSAYYFDAYLQRGICYEHINKNDLAIADYNEAIKQNPKYVEAYYQRALFYASIQKDTQRAISDLSSVLKIKNRNYAAYEMRGQLYLCRHKYMQAKEDFSAAIALKNNWIPLIGRAKANYYMDDLPATISDCEAVIKEKADCAEAFFVRAMAKEKMAMFIEAGKDYNKAVALGLKTPEVIQARANMYYSTMQYKLAWNDYNDLLMNYKIKTAENYCRRGVCYTALKDSLKAKRDFSQALLLDKNNYLIFLYKAENSTKLKHYHVALDDYRRALELNSKGWDVYYSRAKLYMEMERYQEAIADFDIVLKRNEKNAEAYYLRGSCKDFIRDYEGACADLQAAAALYHQTAIERVKKYCN